MRKNRHNSLRLISWNVAGRVHCLEEQVSALIKYTPDLVALQEVRASTAPLLSERLVSGGLIHCVNSFDLAPDKDVLVGPRQYGQLIASRFPLCALAPDLFPVPFPERVLSALLNSPWETIKIHNTHIPPGSSNGWTKIEMMEGIYKRLACASPYPRILCGDFNAPQKELPSGYIVTWGQGILDNGKVSFEGTWCDPQGREDTNERWDRGERGIFEGLRQYDLKDVFRTIQGFDVEEFSHYVHKRHGRRFDHIFASSSLNAVVCKYLHSLREEGLSDHSPLLAVFNPESIH